MAEKYRIATVSAYELALRRRRANESIVTFITPPDPHRLPSLLEFVRSSYRGGQPQVYVYFDFRGLYRFEGIAEDGSIRLLPVAAGGSSGSPLAALTGQQRIRDLASALSYLDNTMSSNERVAIIFWNPILSESEKLLFSKFLASLIYDYNAYLRKHWVVIVTDDPLKVADERVVENSIVVDMEPSTYEERLGLLRLIASDLGLSIGEEELQQFAEALRGLTLHQVESIALRSFYERGKFDMGIMTELKYDIIRKMSGGVVELVKPRHGFGEVGGYDAIKRFIVDAVVRPLRNPEKAKRLGVRLPRGILLFGPPGTGKTWMALALAKELGLPFMKTNAGMLRSKWYGETSRNVKRLRDLAESVAPVVLFIDEIDQLGGRRGTLGEHEETRAALGVLLEWLGDPDRKTIIVAATNRPEDLDEALIRTGRFDYVIPVLYPDANARRQILEVQVRLQKVPIAEDVDLARIAEATELWTAAELAELIQRAARRAFREDADVVEMRHFVEALRTFKINMEQRRQQLERYLQLAEEYANDAELLEAVRETYRVPVRRAEASQPGGAEEW